MTILVTGGTGFLGEHFIKKIVKKEKIRVLDIKPLKKSSLKNLEHKIEYYKGNIENANTVEKASKGCETIVHLASATFPLESNKKPEFYTKLGIIGTFNVLNAARKNSIKRVVFASSATVYGNSKKKKQKETDTLNPKSVYALTKVFGEQYSKLFSELYKIDTISLRFFNIYGPGQHYKKKPIQIIPLTISKNISGQTFEIWGNGLRKRDFLYIDDAVRALELAVKSREKFSGQTFNIGTGKSFSIKETIKIIEKHTGKKTKIKKIKIKNNDIIKLEANTGLASKKLKFKAKTNLDEGIKKTIKWFETN